MKFLYEYEKYDLNDKLLIEGYVNEIKKDSHNIKSPNDAKLFVKRSIERVRDKKFSIKKRVILYALSLLFTIIPFNSHVIGELSKEESDEDVLNILNSYVPVGTNFSRLITFKGGLRDFLDSLAFRESSNTWNKIDKDSSHVGKYQLGNIALKDIGKNFTVDDLKKDFSIWDEKEQDKDIIKLLKKNKYYFRNHMHYIGQSIDGVPITLSGILAASHLLGSKSVRDYLDGKTKKMPKDGNGTTLLDYLDYFNGYDMSKL